MTDAEALIVQLSDPHIGADWGERDPERARRLVEAYLAPGGTLVTAFDQPGSPSQ